MRNGVFYAVRAEMKPGQLVRKCREFLSQSVKRRIEDWCEMVVSLGVSWNIELWSINQRTTK
jgi:hypothetical protein